MNKKLIAAGLAAMLTNLIAGTAAAQDVVYVPVDIFACKYNEGQGPRNLDAVVDTFNSYMDENGTDAYAAWTMTKHYASAEQDFDFVWLGAHRNGETMGAGADTWEAQGGDVLAEFASVATCDMMGLYDSQMYKAPAAGNVPQGGVLLMRNCTLNEDVSWDDLDKASNANAKLLANAGSVAATYNWYPTYGTGENDIDYKFVAAYPNHLEFGKDHDRFGNGGLWRDSVKIWGDIAECDVARVYDIQMRRSGKIRD